MAAVIPLHPKESFAGDPAGRPGAILSLRSRLFEKAIEEAWPAYLSAIEEREAREREIGHGVADLGPRLRVVR